MANESQNHKVRQCNGVFLIWMYFGVDEVNCKFVQGQKSNQKMKQTILANILACTCSI